jgi:hypothetical protein
MAAIGLHIFPTTIPTTAIVMTGEADIAMPDAAMTVRRPIMSMKRPASAFHGSSRSGRTTDLGE